MTEAVYNRQMRLLAAKKLRDLIQSARLVSQALESERLGMSTARLLLALDQHLDGAGDAVNLLGPKLKRISPRNLVWPTPKT